MFKIENIKYRFIQSQVRMSYPSAVPAKWKSTARSDWSQIPYDVACQMSARQAQWSKILSDACVLTSVVAKDFQNFLDTHAMCRSGLSIDRFDRCTTFLPNVRDTFNARPLSHCNL